MIINLTQHPSTPSQVDAGVVDLPARDVLCKALTFEIGGPSGLANNPVSARDAVEARARSIVAEFVTPLVAARAADLLRDGGYEPGDDIVALAMLRPNVAAQGIKAMIGGAPYLMAPLERALSEVGVTPVYALSERVTAEQTQPDGTVKKTSAFKHMGFLEV